MLIVAVGEVTDVQLTSTNVNSNFCEINENMTTFLNKLRRFDAYPKTLEEIRIKTSTGAFGLLSS